MQPGILRPVILNATARLVRAMVLVLSVGSTAAFAQPTYWTPAAGIAGVPANVLSAMSLTPADFSTALAPADRNASLWQLTNAGGLFEQLASIRISRQTVPIDLPTPSGLQRFQIQADPGCDEINSTLTWRTPQPVGRGVLTAILRRSVSYTHLTLPTIYSV